MRPFSSRITWMAILVLSPLAYIGSYYVANMLPGRNSAITLNRERAVQAAVRFAASRQVDARGWSAAVKAQERKAISVVLSHARPPVLEQVAAASVVTVTLRSPQENRWFLTMLTPSGRVVGFRTNWPEGWSVTGDEAARNVAASFLRDFLRPAPFLLPAPKMSVIDKEKERRRFEWKARVPGFPEGEAYFQVELAGNQAIAESCSVTVDPAYLNRLRPGGDVMVYLGILCAVCILALGGYAVVRYVGRAGEKEVSHRRTILVALIFLAFGSFQGYEGAAAGSAPGNGPPPAEFQFGMMLAFIFFVALLGAFFGVAYGAGEGDVRAVYPGKLTSLDALLSGKLFSANVARSILAGGAFAGAMLLVQNVALLATHAMRPANDQEIVNSLTVRFPLGDLLSDTALDAVTIAALGLLLPIALLRPRVRNERAFYALLPLFSMVLAGVFTTDTSSWRNTVITLLVSAAATCVPFFYGDLLASISSIIALDLVAKLTYRSVATQGWGQIGAPVVSVGLVFLLVEVWFAWRGRVYEEGEVRPVYASLLAEHQALQAEVGAAREAQLRLLPDAPPSIAGLSIAGSCVPAREVGGDFYDYYPLDGHRLGVFVAEGGTGELGPAMTIALAKGYLLYTARLDLPPVETLRRLRDFLGSDDQGDGGVSMLYAVTDTRAGTMRFARAGASPRLAIGGKEPVEEVALCHAGEMAIRHGVVPLAPKDVLVFYTDGLAAQLLEKKGQTVAGFLAMATSQAPEHSAGGLHSAILKAAIRKNERPPDDVTTVVIRIEESGEQAMEVVA